MISQLAIITALILPFLMKNIEKKEKEKEIAETIIQIIKRVKDYLNNLMIFKEEGGNLGRHKFSKNMPFFKSIDRKFPEILMKIGVEIDNVTEQLGSGSHTYSQLLLIGKYRLNIWGFPRLTSLENDQEIKPNKEIIEKILAELIFRANMNYKIFKTSKNLAKFN